MSSGRERPTCSVKNSARVADRDHAAWDVSRTHGCECRQQQAAAQRAARSAHTQGCDTTRQSPLSAVPMQRCSKRSSAYGLRPTVRADPCVRGECPRAVSALLNARAGRIGRCERRPRAVHVRASHAERDRSPEPSVCSAAARTHRRRRSRARAAPRTAAHRSARRRRRRRSWR